MINVVQLQHSNNSAGKVAQKLHKAFKEAGLNSSILSLHPSIDDTDEIKHVGRWSNLKAWLDIKIRSYLTRHNHKEYGLYSFPVLGTNVSKLEQVRNADIIYFHWVQGGFLNLTNIEQILKTGKQIIYFMHDQWIMTGGCHYSFTCEKYINKCIDCQMFPSNKRIDLPKIEFCRKYLMLSKYKNITFVSPSRWLFDCAKKSFLTNEKPVNYIPNIYDDQIYKPIDKKIAKSILGIDSDEIVITFGAIALNSPYKGWAYLQNALELLSKYNTTKRILVLVFGRGFDKQFEDAIPFKVHYMGYLNDEYSKVLVYSAADVFIAPSLAETFGYVIMESLACGTPVVAFNIGGIPDLIKHKENGYLAEYKDAEDIASGIIYCIENNITGRLQPIFERKKTISKHLDLMNTLLESSKGGKPSVEFTQ